MLMLHRDEVDAYQGRHLPGGEASGDAAQDPDTLLVALSRLDGVRQILQRHRACHLETVSRDAAMVRAETVLVHLYNKGLTTRCWDNSCCVAITSLAACRGMLNVMHGSGETDAAQCSHEGYRQRRGGQCPMQRISLGQAGSPAF